LGVSHGDLHIMTISSANFYRLREPTPNKTSEDSVP